MDKKRKFKFKLASHLGMTVSELENRMTHNEFMEWIEYSESEPLLNDRIELMLAQLTSTLIRVNGGKATANDLLVTLTKEDKEALHVHKANNDIDEFFKGRE